MLRINIHQLKILLEEDLFPTSAPIGTDQKTDEIRLSSMFL